MHGYVSASLWRKGGQRQKLTSRKEIPRNYLLSSMHHRRLHGRRRLVVFHAPQANLLMRFPTQPGQQISKENSLYDLARSCS